MTSDHEERATAWEETFRRFYPSLYRALVAVLLDGELARDALQEAFVEGLRRPPPSDHALAGWLFRAPARATHPRLPAAPTPRRACWLASRAGDTGRDRDAARSARARRALASAHSAPARGRRRALLPRAHPAGDRRRPRRTSRDGRRDAEPSPEAHASWRLPWRLLFGASSVPTSARSPCPP